jgi:hypothetical protein
MSATTDRVQRALSEFLHAERVDGNAAMFAVYSGSGARHVVELATGGPDCTCEEWQHEGICLHILFVLLTQPQTLDRLTRRLQTATTVCADGGDTQ